MSILSCEKTLEMCLQSFISCCPCIVYTKSKSDLSHVSPSFNIRWYPMPHEKKQERVNTEHFLLCRATEQWYLI